jgi:glycerol-3-phosphate acyltransferase PlsY
LEFFSFLTSSWPAKIFHLPFFLQAQGGHGISPQILLFVPLRPAEIIMLLVDFLGVLMFSSEPSKHL